MRESRGSPRRVQFDHGREVLKVRPIRKSSSVEEILAVEEKTGSVSLTQLTKALFAAVDGEKIGQHAPDELNRELVA